MMDSVTLKQLYERIQPYTSKMLIAKILLDEFIIIPKEGARV